MSHFSVLVCVPSDVDVNEYLTTVLAEWDENREVDPWRDYETGSPEEHWWVQSVRRDAEHHRNGTGIRPYDPDVLGWSSHGPVRETVERQKATFAAAAKWSQRLGENPDWQTVVELYNEKYKSAKEELHYDPDLNAAYTITTYNPNAKWDWWTVGGRWRGHFIVKSPNTLGLIHTSYDDGYQRCDGGPLHALDFDIMRSLAEQTASERYDRWEEICSHTPPARSWSDFYGLANAGVMSIGVAREQYQTQPRVVEARDHGLSDWWGTCPVEEFLPPREEYVAEARNAAVPGYALVTLDREWKAPGRMGWFGMSTDTGGERSTYRSEVNKYLDNLPPETVLVVVDCHI